PSSSDQPDSSARASCTSWSLSGWSFRAMRILQLALSKRDVPDGQGITGRPEAKALIEALRSLVVGLRVQRYGVVAHLAKAIERRREQRAADPSALRSRIDGEPDEMSRGRTVAARAILEADHALLQLGDVEADGMLPAEGQRLQAVAPDWGEGGGFNLHQPGQIVQPHVAHGEVGVRVRWRVAAV